MSRFQSNLRNQIRKLPNFLRFVRIIHYYSILFIRVINHDGSENNLVSERGTALDDPQWSPAGYQIPYTPPASHLSNASQIDGNLVGTNLEAGSKRLRHPFNRGEDLNSIPEKSYSPDLRVGTIDLPMVTEAVSNSTFALETR